MYKILSLQSPSDEQINQWFEANPDIEIISITKQMMNDFYNQSAPPMICNQWIEVTILYKTPKHP